jgi:hypothetical protein
VLRPIWRILFALVLAVSAAASANRKPGVNYLKVPVLAPADVAIRVQDIQATVGSAPAKVVDLVSPTGDLILMLVLDLTSDLTAAEPAKSTLLSEIEQLPPRVHVALLRAQDGLRVVQDPTTNRAAIGAGITSLAISGYAGLLDSIETAASVGDSVLSKSSVRLAILYITDSSVTNYRQDFSNPVINSSDAGDLSRKFPEALIKEQISKLDANLAASQAPVFIVHTSYRTDRLNEAYLNGLSQLAYTTGGTAVICRSTGEIPSAIRNVLATIGNHYSVTVEVPKVAAPSLDVRLAIVGPDEEQLVLPYRSRFALRKK